MRRPSAVAPVSIDVCIVNDRDRPTGGRENRVSVGSPATIGKANRNSQAQRENLDGPRFCRSGAVAFRRKKPRSTLGIIVSLLCGFRGGWRGPRRSKIPQGRKLFFTRSLILPNRTWLLVGIAGESFGQALNARIGVGGC